MAENLIVSLDGEVVSASSGEIAALARAILVSLFTWGRAADDDKIDGDDRKGWWGDSFAKSPGDQIGSRLWQLYREKLTDQTRLKAEFFIKEALQWLIDDGVASKIEVTSERVGDSTLGVAVSIWRKDGSQIDLRFENLWEPYINGI